MKVIGVPIEVELKKGWPVQICWEHRRMTVTHVVDWWVARGRWWAKEETRVYFRLITRLGTVEIYRSGSEWTLARLFD